MDRKTLTVALNDTARYELNLSPLCSDPDNDVLNYTISGNPLPGDTIINSLYVFQASAATIGKNGVELIASDPSGLKDTMELVLNVTASGTDNNPPEVTIIAPDKDSSATNSETYVVDMLCSDASGIDSVYAVFNGKTIYAVLVDGHYKITVTGLVAGVYNAIELTVSDKSVNALKTTKTINIKYAQGFTITYNGNEKSSGTVPVDTSKYETGAAATVKGNTGDLIRTGYVFAGWNTAADGSGTAYAVGAPLIMGTQNVTLFARWTQNATYTVTYDGNTKSSGAVPIDLGKYETGAVVTVKSNSGNLVKTGFTFVGWATSASGTEIYKEEDTFSIGTADVVLYAIWKKNTTYKLTITSTNGEVTISPDATVFDSGTVVTLTPVPSTGYHFTEWSGALSGTTSPATITMNSAKSVTANFEANAPNTFALTVLAPNGTVQKSPDQTQYDSGTVVKLTAVPDAGYQFTGWSGGITGTTNPSSVTMNEAKTVTANFVIKTFTLSVTATNGSVTKLPDADSFDSGTVVTLTAVPGAGYQFIGWEGDLTGAENPTSIKMNAKKSVTAKFALKTYALSISSTNGSVTKSPDATTYDSGTVVTLTAVPKAGYQFIGWDGDLTGTENPASVKINEEKKITAKFEPKIFKLSVSAANGSVTKSLDATSYDSGTVVVLTAVPNAGYQFTGWGGDLTGTTSSTSVKMDKDRSVTAKFSLITYTLSYDGNGNTGGSVPSSVTGIESGRSVTVSSAGSLVRDGYEFLGWNTDATASTAKYAVASAIIINADTKLYAIWKAMPTFTVTYHPNEGGAVNSHGSGLVPKDDNVYTEGKMVTVLGNPGNLKRTGYVFLGWTRVQNDRNPISSFKMGGANVTLYARWAILDADGNEYDEVKIGDQVWMVQNLKTTTLKDGRKLSNSKGREPSYAPSTHGALYNGWCYKSGVVRELAPDGWRAAESFEWSILFNYINFRYYTIASKENWKTSTNDWGIGYNSFNNNTTGFTAYPDGYGSINADGEYEYSGLTQSAGFWVSYGEYWGEAFYMNYDESGRSLDKVNDDMFYSVRCVREY